MGYQTVGPLVGARTVLTNLQFIFFLQTTLKICIRICLYLCCLGKNRTCISPKRLRTVMYNILFKQCQQKNSSDLKGFLDHYKKDNEKMTVLLPESEKSILLMTVHKAKGLEFPVVILPNLDFGTDIKGFTKHLPFSNFTKNDHSFIAFKFFLTYQPHHLVKMAGY